MRFVLDANVIISALITDGAVRTALRATVDDVYTAWYVRVEIDAHRVDIQRKSDLTTSSYDSLMAELWRLIEAIPRQKLVPYLQPAATAMRSIDPDDTPYVAAALSIDGTVVSNDRAFERQELVPHLWTSQFVERAIGNADEDPNVS